ncbi:MAG TPA: DNA cytosine methyltransferase [Solirubrobacterales bacterium]|nr:DNA cytosine methyltransferase [Solirubrobacterales bacterium]
MKAVSLFSGCGGLDLGLERAGFDVVFASDLDPYCAASYALNFPGVPFYEGTAADLDKELLAKVSKGATLGQIDLLAGGPPCPPFSKSRFYRTEKPRALEDAVGEETINAYLKVLEAVRPRAFLLENVAGLAYKVHESALELILSTAEGLGYEISREVLNAADYGVPQMRERFFVVGMLDGKFEFPEPSHAKDPDSVEDAERLPWVTAGAKIGDLDTEENADDTGHFAGGKYHDLLKEIPPGDNYLFLTAKRGHPEPKFEWRKRYWSFLLKLSPDLPSWTIQARRSNNMGPLHWRNRILRIEEVKRLQTFPDEWQLTGTTERQWRQVGNAVPPLLAETLGAALSEQLGVAEDYQQRAA